MCDFCGFEFVNSEIIQEEQGFCALDEHIVYAHGDKVYADGVEAVCHLGEDYFCADAVCAGDEYGVFVVAFEKFFVIVEAEHACETAGGVDDAGAES